MSNEQQMKHKPRMSLGMLQGIFTFMALASFGLLFLAIGFAKPQAKQDAPPPPQPVAVQPEKEYINPLEECDLSIPLPFGVKAKNDCYLQCFSPSIDRNLCMRSCDKLVVANFAKRVGASVPPQDLAKLTVKSCRDFAAEEPADDSGTSIQNQDQSATPPELIAPDTTFRAAVEYLQVTAPEVELYSMKSARERFTSAEAIFRRLLIRFPDDSKLRPLHVPLKSALCLRQAVAAAQAAVAESAIGDLFSERYYRSYEEKLLESLRHLEETIPKELVVVPFADAGEERVQVSREPAPQGAS